MLLVQSTEPRMLRYIPVPQLSAIKASRFPRMSVTICLQIYWSFLISRNI